MLKKQLHKMLHSNHIKQIFYRRFMMRRVLLIGLLALVTFLAGCESLRFGASQSQKKNAYLHNRAAQIAADTAKVEGSSNKLQALTGLCSVQSRAFCSDYGLPSEFPPAESVEDVLSQSSYAIAAGAISDSALRPDGWDTAEAVIDLGIGIAAIFGGVYGTKAFWFLSQAKVKSKALREIVTGNELFKRMNTESTSSFKDAHKTQSPQTRQVVTQMKNS
jgi:hypothetical protein